MQYREHITADVREQDNRKYDAKFARPFANGNQRSRVNFGTNFYEKCLNCYKY